MAAAKPEEPDPPVSRATTRADRPRTPIANIPVTNTTATRAMKKTLPRAPQLTCTKTPSGSGRHRNRRRLGHGDRGYRVPPGPDEDAARDGDQRHSNENRAERA